MTFNIKKDDPAQDSGKMKGNPVVAERSFIYPSAGG